MEARPWGIDPAPSLSNPVRSFCIGSKASFPAYHIWHEANAMTTCCGDASSASYDDMHESSFCYKEAEKVQGFHMLMFPPPLWKIINPSLDSTTLPHFDP